MTRIVVLLGLGLLLVASVWGLTLGLSTAVASTIVFDYFLTPPAWSLRLTRSDDLAILHLQYSTQWDSLAHVGQMFDADGDGLAEAVYYNGYRPGVHIFGPSEGADAGK